MRIINGVTIYEEGEPPVLPQNMPPIPYYMYSKYGWRIVVDKYYNKYWSSMDEIDYREIIGQLYNINPKDVDLSLVLCHSGGGSCITGTCSRFCNSGTTPGGSFCYCPLYKPKHAGC